MKRAQYKMFRLYLTLAATILSGSAPCFGWGDGGHMVVAKIAQDRLNPHAKAEADRLLAISISPARTTARTADFITAAHWADDVRPLAEFSHTADLHFIDHPFTTDGSDLPADLPKRDNIVKALDEEVATLKNSTDDEEKAQALRFIIHFVGDIHQPLHCATRVTSALLEGDRGGNDFLISEINGEGKKQTVKLHSYWDGGIGTLPRMGAHFQPPPVEEVIATAQALVAKFPDTAVPWNAGTPFDYEKWAQESFETARDFVYTGLKQKKLPSNTYNDAAIGIAQKRIVMAGYRLSALLNAIWPDAPAN